MSDCFSLGNEHRLKKKRGTKLTQEFLKLRNQGDVEDFEKTLEKVKPVD